MKFFILSAVLISAPAFAEFKAESISILCTGRQDATNGPKVGPFVVKASTPDARVDSPWTFEAGWSEEAPILNEGTVCGVKLPSGIQCVEQRAGGQGFALAQSCGPEVVKGGIPDVEYGAQVVLQSESGYFNCQTAGGVDVHIRLSGCVAK